MFCSAYFLNHGAPPRGPPRKISSTHGLEGHETLGSNTPPCHSVSVMCHLTNKLIKAEEDSRWSGAEVLDEFVKQNKKK